MSIKSSATVPQGHVIIRSGQEDQGQSGLVVVSNTTPEEIDRINSAKNSDLSKHQLERKKTASRVASDVEKNVRIRTNRVPSARSAQSGSAQRMPLSPKSDFPSPKLNAEDLQQPDEFGKTREKEKYIFEETKFHDYEAVLQGRLDLYQDEEENITCYRFPHLSFCACGVDYLEIKSQPPVEIYPGAGIYISTLHQSLISKNLLKIGITHVLNLSAQEFTKRTQYFEYLNFDIFDTHDEDIKKHFRITNRFIAEALQSGGKVLVHSFESRSRAPAFILAYLIGKKKKTLKNGLEIIKQSWPDTEINNYFFKQLEQYDLEKLAIGSSINV